MLSSPLPPDIFCKDQNVHQVVHLTYTIWGANEPNGREYENCIETRLKSFSNGTQKYPKQIQKHPVYIVQSNYLRYIFFHFGKGMRVGTTPPARRVEGDFSASFQKSRFFISEASPIARCYFIFLLENEIIFSKGISGRRIFRQFLNRIFLQLELFDYKYKWTKATQEVLFRKFPFKI